MNIDRKELIQKLRGVKLDGGNPIQWVHLICDAADLLEQDEVRFQKEEVEPEKHENPYTDTVYKCPLCKTEVGGYTFGRSPDDWGYHRDKFCSQCGVKIKWGNE